uniref:CSON005418 protein n=1 Tax=Culicoides sonorensis TaxID=179676 RepID=A0A336L688_CULSO
MCDEEEIIEWKTEAQGVINDVKAHVSSIEVSAVLESNERKIYLNVVTLEDEKYCIRLDNEGFIVVGKEFDTTNLEDEESQVFETPYSLLSSISKKFTESFGNRLISELNKLQQN